MITIDQLKDIKERTAALKQYLSIDEKNFSEKTRKCFEEPMMDRDYFENLTDRFRSPHLWVWENGQWRLRHEVR